MHHSSAPQQASSRLPVARILAQRRFMASFLGAMSMASSPQVMGWSSRTRLSE